ncbi:hypothetical protein JCM3774_002332 [Rhodotorula dairenensis]
MTVRLYGPACLIAALAAARGYRSHSLSKSGAAAAALLGYSALANPLSVFGVCLLGFYLAGSRATKVKAAVKATYEEPEFSAAQPGAAHDLRRCPASPIAVVKAGGNRSATQVACNAWLGTACAVAWRVLYSGEKGIRAGWTAEGEWCVLDARKVRGAEGTSRVLVITAVAFWAACCGDTLGILSSRPPILITTLRSCPRGTNGGVSAWGTFVSVLGGLFVGVLAVASLALQGQASACAQVGAGRYGWAAELVVLGGLSGFCGSLFDSLLGGLFQPTYFSKTRSLVVHSPMPSPTYPDEEIVRVRGSGWDVLSNNAVNVLSTLLTAGCAAWYASQ